jgi:hypothetical protein
VRDFVDRYRRRHQRARQFYARQPTIVHAIDVAALARTEDDKRHSHQRRIPALALGKANAALQKANLRRCKTFDELIGAVNSTIREIHMIGPLVVYDTAERIGAYLGLEPESVYLHRGTRKGAKALGLGYGRDSLRLDELPKALRRLSAAELEDFLCIYKDELGRHRERSPRATR